MRIGLIGGGFMGEALLSAALKKGVVEPAGAAVCDVAEARRDHLASAYGVKVTSDGAAAIDGADVVVLAVKPQEFPGVAPALRGRLTQEQTVLSIMAGVLSEQIAGALDHGAVVRVMPNTPAFIGEAMSVWTVREGVPSGARERCARLLQAMGRELEVPEEKYIDMATALSGSGPGFVFLVLEALIDAGVHIGLRRDMAEQLAVQMLAGSALLARGTGKHPAELRNMVTSPGGTTAAGLAVLEDAGLRGAIIGAVEAAYERAKELSE